MMKKSKTILFFGTEDFSVASLQALIDDNYTIGAVITKPDSKKGRGQKTQVPAVKAIAQEYGIPVWQPQRLADIYDDINHFDAPVGILVSFGKIIPQSIIDLFTPGIINIHPSKLPLYRGPSPIESAIINGDTETAITIMQLSDKMDAGPIYTQQTIPLSGTETQPRLYNKLAQAGAKLLIETVPGILDGTLQAVDQDDAIATYCQLLSKDLSNPDPATLNATEIERRIRAHLAYPKTRLSFAGQSLIITKAHVTLDADETTIPCAQSSLLAIDELRAPNGKTMTAQAYLRGIR